MSSSEVATTWMSGVSADSDRWVRPGQQLAAGQIAGRAEQHDHVRIEMLDLPPVRA